MFSISSVTEATAAGATIWVGIVSIAASSVLTLDFLFSIHDGINYPPSLMGPRPL